MFACVMMHPLQEDNACAGLLLEQAAHCLLAQPHPHARKFAFHQVLAGLRYNLCDQKGLALRAYRCAGPQIAHTYLSILMRMRSWLHCWPWHTDASHRTRSPCCRQVLDVYNGRQWALIEEHLHDVLGKQCLQAGDVQGAARHFADMLLCPYNSPACQKANMVQFLDALQQDAEQVGALDEQMWWMSRCLGASQRLVLIVQQLMWGGARMAPLVRRAHRLCSSCQCPSLSWSAWVCSTTARHATPTWKHGRWRQRCGAHWRQRCSRRQREHPPGWTVSSAERGELGRMAVGVCHACCMQGPLADRAVLLVPACLPRRRQPRQLGGRSAIIAEKPSVAQDIVRALTSGWRPQQQRGTRLPGAGGEHHPAPRRTRHLPPARRAAAAGAAECGRRGMDSQRRGAGPPAVPRLPSAAMQAGD